MLPFSVNNFLQNNVTLEVRRIFNEKRLVKCDKCETQLSSLYSFTSFFFKFKVKYLHIHKKLSSEASPIIDF